MKHVILNNLAGIVYKVIMLYIDYQIDGHYEEDNVYYYVGKFQNPAVFYYHLRKDCHYLFEVEYHCLRCDLEVQKSKEDGQVEV